MLISDLIARELVDEVDFALKSNRPCSYTRSSAQMDSVLPDLSVRGFMQPIYACRTCASVAGAPVGVCEPCMLRCHAEHDVHEVGVRRMFRCDCPTDRCGARCQAQPAGEPDAHLPVNGSNAYGHNFEEKWCSCNGAYDKERDTMMQCVCCDEWYHERHLPGFTSTLEPEGVVCHCCVQKHPFLRCFARYDSRSCSKLAPGAEATGIMQPWVVCLTCTRGADDGRGVCMACAAACHAGHVLGVPRISVFACDCTDLCATCTHVAAAAAVSVHESPVLVDAAAMPELSEGSSATPVKLAAAASVASSTPVASSVHTPATPGDETFICPPDPAALWCASRAVAVSEDTPAAHHNFVDKVCIFLAEEDDLLLRLCRCLPCMRAYADARVITWFVGDTDDMDAVEVGVQPPSAAAAATAAASAASAPASVPSAAERQAALAFVMAGSLSGAQLRLLFPSLPADFRTSYEKGLDALQTMPHTEQLNALHAYNEMSSEVMPYLRQIADTGRAITEADIRVLFERMKSNRRVRSRME